MSTLLINSTISEISPTNWTATESFLALISSPEINSPYAAYPITSPSETDTSSVNVPNFDSSLLALLLFRDTVRFYVQRLLVPLVTLIGIFGNLITMVVMCQRRMSTSSTHIYLAALALSDSLYLTFVFLLSLVHYPSVKVNPGALARLFWSCIPALHFACDFASNTSIWLTVCFTIERYIVIRYPIKGKVVCTTSRAIRMILLVALICCTITLPTLFEWKAGEIVADDGSGSREMIIVSTELGTNALFRSLYYWFTVVAFVFIPLTILTIFNLFLIRSVRKSSQKRRQWISSTTQHSEASTELPQKVKVAPKPALITGSLVQHPTAKRPSILVPKSRSLIRLTLRSTKRKIKCSPSKANPSDFFTPTYRILLRQDAHITRLLIAVVLFFLVCQLPSALVIIYTTTASEEEVENERQDAVLKILGNIVNLLMAVNSAGNFMLYCLLSRKYRRTLRDLLARIGRKKN